MRDKFEFTKQTSYPHMKPLDKIIWEKFIDQHPNAYDEIQYDFLVGNPPPFNTLMDNGEDLNQDMLYRLKIDVVGHKGNQIDIIEIKPNAGAAAIGQVQAYGELYLRDENHQEKINLVLITDIERTDMRFLCEKANVKLIVVE